MFGLTRLWTAIATLAHNVTALAGTVADANERLRSRLQLDAPDQEEQSVSTLTNRVPIEATPEPTRNGRARKQATATE